MRVLKTNALGISILYYDFHGGEIAYIIRARPSGKKRKLFPICDCLMRLKQDNCPGFNRFHLFSPVTFFFQSSKAHLNTYIKAM